MASERLPYSDHTETIHPTELRVQGEIPSWVNGRLVRIGPGLFSFGEFKASYPMDGMGFLHSFNISDGKATFQSRFIGSETYKVNIAEKRFVHAEFGTPVSPDPSKGMFAKLKSKVTGDGGMSDNSNHNVIYWKQMSSLLVMGTPFMAIDTKTLETVDKVKLPEALGVDLVSEHAQVGSDGAMYILGSHVKGKPTYNIVRVPPTSDLKTSFEKAEIIFTVQGQFKVTPTSHHSFIMTDNFFVIIECPMEINILKILTKSTILEAITWDPSVTTKFHVFNRQTGEKIKQKIECPAFHFLHSSNAYEQEEHLVLDLFVLNKFSTKDLFFTRKELASPDYMNNKPWNKLDVNRAVRFVIPTNAEALQHAKSGDNLVRLADEKAEAVVHKNHIELKSRPLTGQGYERLQYPCINSSVKSKVYNYFYSGGCGESDQLQFGVGKFDVMRSTEEVLKWEAKERQFLTEPVFIQNPEDPSEDGGVLLFTLLDYADGDDRLVVLDAKSMTTLATAHFSGGDKPPFTLPEADHGVFIPN